MCVLLCDKRTRIQSSWHGGRLLRCDLWAQQSGHFTQPPKRDKFCQAIRRILLFTFIFMDNVECVRTNICRCSVKCTVEYHFENSRVKEVMGIVWPERGG